VIDPGIEHLLGVLQDCTVRISWDERLGTGFFVAPGRILTCAHVLAQAQGPVSVTWRRRAYEAIVLEVLEQPSKPDLALIGLDEPWPDHDCVFLDEHASVHDLLHTFGYTQDYRSGESVILEVEGDSFDEHHHLLKLREGHVVPGLSGAPLLNERTGGVCGVVKRTRDPHSNLGARAIPMAAVFDALPSLKALNHAFHDKHPEWTSRLPAQPGARPPAVPPLPRQFDWPSICARMLLERLRVTTNRMTAAAGHAFDSKELFIPPNLVHRPVRQAGSGDDTRPSESSRPYDTERFFVDVVAHGQARRLAITGEPGSGKTMFLQATAQFLIEQTDKLPIWISLTELEGKTLERYLLEDWLKDATQSLQPTLEMQEALARLFLSGRVYLLLDGLDELRPREPGTLHAIADIFRGWVLGAKIILSCRLNTWYGANAYLDSFETYQLLPLTYALDAGQVDQVGQFIDRWFHADPPKAARLRTELRKPALAQVRALVKNPLYLALLCRSWSSREGRLPETRAELYMGFVRAFYQWKRERYAIDEEEERDLTGALSHLALATLSRDHPAFAFSTPSMAQHLSVAQRARALELGWITRLGRSTEDQDEAVYSFSHVSFQEFFAATAITDRTQLLHPGSPDADPITGVFQALLPHWNEIVLLWIGRADVHPHDKAGLIADLMNFDDRCGGFYRHRAMMLAASASSQYEFTGATDLLWTVAKWSLTTAPGGYGQTSGIPYPIARAAQKALVRADSNRVVEILTELLRVLSQRPPGFPPGTYVGEAGPPTLLRYDDPPFGSISDSDVFSIIETAGLDHNTTLRDALFAFLRSARYIEGRRQALDTLRVVGVGDDVVIHELTRLFHAWSADRTLDNDLQDKLLDVLAGVARNHPAVGELLHSLVLDRGQRLSANAIHLLTPFAHRDPKILAALIDSLEDPDEHISWVAVAALRTLRYYDQSVVRAYQRLADQYLSRVDVVFALLEADPSQLTAIERAAELLLRDDPSAFDELRRMPEVPAPLLGRIEEALGHDLDDKIRAQLAYILARANPESDRPIKILVALLVEGIRSRRRWSPVWSMVAEFLAEVAPERSDVVDQLLDLLDHADREVLDDVLRCIELVGGRGKRIADRLFARLAASRDADPAARLLRMAGSIAPRDPRLLPEAARLLEKDAGSDVENVLDMLREIKVADDRILARVLELAKTGFGDIRRRALEALSEIGRGHPEAVKFVLTEVSNAPARSFTLESIAIAMLTPDLCELAVSAGRRRFENTVSSSRDDFLGTGILWFCAESLPYPAFYHAWHSASA